MSLFEESLKCQFDFGYFAEHHVLVTHQKKTIAPMILEPMHKRFVEFLTNTRFGLVKKFRQSGFSTLCSMYGLWQALFRTDKRVLIMSRSLTDAKKISEQIMMTIANLPDGLCSEIEFYNDNCITFNNSSSIYTLPSYNYRYNKPFDLVFFDEASTWGEPAKRWKELCAGVLKENAKAFVVSQPGNRGGWFHGLYKRAKEQTNQFKIFECHYQEYSLYQDENKMKKYKEIIGYKEFRHEFEAHFISDRTPMEIECEILDIPESD